MLSYLNLCNCKALCTGGKQAYLMKKFFLRSFLIIFLLVILVYVTNITSIPSKIILFKGEELNIGTVKGISLNENSYETIQTSTSINEEDKVEKKQVTVSLFNLIDVKDIEVDTISQTTVIPLGNSVGLKLYTSGVLVVGMTEIEGQKPYENTGLEEGDMIVEVNEKEVTCTSELLDSVSSSNGESLNIKYIRDGEEYVATIAPVKTEKDEYKLGLWVRDRSCRNRNN